MPFFNRQNNDDLILTIQAAGVSCGRNGFRKDKGGEKLAESEVNGLPLSQLAEKEHSSNTAPTAQRSQTLSTSAVKLFVPTRAERNLFRLCRVQPNLVHLCTNFRTTILSRCQCPVYYKFFILAVSSFIRLITSSNDRLRSSYMK